MNLPVGDRPNVVSLPTPELLAPAAKEQKPLGLPLATPLGPRATSSLGSGLAAAGASTLAFIRGLELEATPPRHTDAALQGAMILAVNEKGRFSAEDAAAMTGALWKAYRPVPAVPESSRNGIPFGRLFDRLDARSVPPAGSPGAQREVRALADAVAADLANGRNVLLFPQDLELVSAVLERTAKTPLILAATKGSKVALSDVTRSFAEAPVKGEWLAETARTAVGADQWPAPKQPSALVQPSETWFAQKNAADGPEMPSEKANVVAAFLETLRKNPNRIFAVDEVLGEVTYARMATLTYLLTDAMQKLPGQNVGVILGNSILDTALGYALALAGKTATMPHPTWKSSQIEPAVELAKVETIITAQKVIRGLIDRKTKSDEAALEDGSLTPEEVSRDPYLTPYGRAEDALHNIEPYLFNAPVAKAAVAALAEKTLGSLGISHVVESLQKKAKKLDADGAFINLFTSGTTGTPKCVVKPHDSILPNVRELSQALDIRPDDILCSAAPPFHIVGTMVKTIQSVMGLPEVKIPDPRMAKLTAEAIEARQATIYVGTPTLIRMMLDKAEPGQLDSLRVIVTGAEPLSSQLEARIRKMAPNAEIRQGYGATEMGVVTFESFDPSSPEDRSLGSVLPGVDVRLVDPADPSKEVPTGEPGILVARGPSVITPDRGYMGNVGKEPGRFTRLDDGDPFYVSGDLVQPKQVTRPDGTEVTILKYLDRMERFTKRKEMIQHQYIDGVLEDLLAERAERGPVGFTVEGPAKNDEPTLVAFVVADEDGVLRDKSGKELSIEDINAELRRKYSSLYYLDEVRVVRGNTLMRDALKVELGHYKKLAKEPHDGVVLHKD